MPFIGQDWRSPGEQWVKTHKGSWERLKLLDKATQFLGFQSSDSSSLDSDSSISDNETGFMESECLIIPENQFGVNLTENEKLDSLGENVRKESVFILNSSPSQVSKVSKFQKTNSIKTTNNLIVSDETPRQPMKSISNMLPNQSTSDEHTITEFNSTINRTKNTSIQNIISQYERQQQMLADHQCKKPNRIGRQSSFDEAKIDLKQPFLRSIKQRHLLTSKSIDQPMDLEEQPASKFSFVRKNFEKLLNPLNAIKKEDKKTDANKITIHEKQIEKPTKHLTIKQCIRKIDLNTKHLENDEKLNSEQTSIVTLNKTTSLRTANKSSNVLNSQPHCPIILKHTKEICGYNTLSETFLRLDFYNAIRDIRRFNYVCKLLHLLITQNLTSLSGCATKLMFNLLEEIAFQVAGNQQNIHVLHTLLRDVQKIMKKYYCWGRPIGSTVLWEQHLKTIENICQIVKNIEIKPPPKDGKGFRDLPAELIRTILLQLSDYRDLMNSGNVNDTMKSFMDEQYIWRELCKYHFTNRQIKQFLKDNQGNKNFILERPLNEKFIRLNNADNLNWEKVFHSLRKKFGLKEEYADSLFLCRHCRSLYWRMLGHPCLIAQMLEEMNKENTDTSPGQFNLANEDNNSRPIDPPDNRAQVIRIQERIQQVRPMNPIINNQIDLNRQINNLNRVNNQIVNNEIRQANVEDENRYVPHVSDSIPITPEAFLKFFSL